MLELRRRGYIEAESVHKEGKEPGRRSGTENDKVGSTARMGDLSVMSRRHCCTTNGLIVADRNDFLSPFDNIIGTSLWY